MNLCRKIAILLIAVMFMQTSVLADERVSVMEENDSALLAQSYIGGNIVLTDESYYINGAKGKFDEGDAYFDESGEFFISQGVLSTFGFSYKNSSLTYMGKAINISPVIKNDVSFFCFKKMCELAGIDTYDDGRGFIIAGDGALGYSNSPQPSKNTEKSDVIFRYINFDRPHGMEIIQKIKSGKHSGKSKFLATPDRIEKVLLNKESDAYAKMLYDYTIKEADWLCTDNGNKLTEYVFTQSRLLTPCTEIQNKMKTLSAAYLLTKEDKYAERILAEIKNCLDESKWPNWNLQAHTTNGVEYKGHFLDGGFIASGVAMGYDAIREYLSDEDKEWILNRLYDVYFSVCIDAYEGNYQGTEFRTGNTNWGAVGAGGVLALSLAVCEDTTGDMQKDIAYLIENAMHSMEYILCVLYPDGVWYEGLVYWEYVIEFLMTYCILPLENFCNDDYGFWRFELIRKTFEFEIDTKTNLGPYNFSDVHSEKAEKLLPEGYIAAMLSGDSSFMTTQYNARMATDTEKNTLNILFYEPSLVNSQYMKEVSTDNFYRGEEISIMREGNFGTDATYFAAKGGTNTYTGSHFDKGSFIFSQSGTRWALDLGADNYDVSGGYSGEGGWTLYRKRTEGHNCVVINPEDRADYGDLSYRDENTWYFGGQKYNGRGYVEKFQKADKSSFAIYNLTDVYDNNCILYKRGFYLGEQKRTLTVRDEITLSSSKNENEIYWFMHTFSDILIDIEKSDKHSAVLTDKEGNKLYISGYVSGCGQWYFEERAAEPFDSTMRENGEFSRTAFKKLALVTTAQGGAEISITVRLGDSEGEILNTPLSQWENEKGNLERQVKILSNEIIKVNAEGEAVLETLIPYGAKKAELYVNGSLYEERTEFNFFETESFTLKTSDISSLNAQIKLKCIYDDYTVEAEKDIILQSPQEVITYHSCDFSDVDFTKKIDKGIYFYSHMLKWANTPEHISTRLITKEGDTKLEMTINDTRITGSESIQIIRQAIPSGKEVEFSLDFETDDPVRMYFGVADNDQNSDTHPNPYSVYFYVTALKGNLKIKLNGKTYEIEVRSPDGHVLMHESGNYEYAADIERFQLHFFSTLKAGSQIIIDNIKLYAMDYSKLFTEKITRNNGKVSATLDESMLLGGKIYMATYKDCDMTQLTDIRLLSGNEISCDEASYTRFFIWNGNLSSLSKYFEFRKS